MGSFVVSSRKRISVEQLNPACGEQMKVVSGGPTATNAVSVSCLRISCTHEVNSGNGGKLPVRFRSIRYFALYETVQSVANVNQAVLEDLFKVSLPYSMHVAASFEVEGRWLSIFTVLGSNTCFIATHNLQSQPIRKLSMQVFASRYDAGVKGHHMSHSLNS